MSATIVLTLSLCKSEALIFVNAGYESEEAKKYFETGTDAVLTNGYLTA